MKNAKRGLSLLLALALCLSLSLPVWASNEPTEGTEDDPWEDESAEPMSMEEPSIDEYKPSLDADGEKRITSFFELKRELDAYDNTEPLKLIVYEANPYEEEEEPFVFSESITIPTNAVLEFTPVYWWEPGTVIIPEGVQVTVNGHFNLGFRDLYINGTLLIEGCGDRPGMFQVTTSSRYAHVYGKENITVREGGFVQFNNDEPEDAGALAALLLEAAQEPSAFSHWISIDGYAIDRDMTIPENCTLAGDVCVKQGCTLTNDGSIVGDAVSVSGSIINNSVIYFFTHFDLRLPQMFFLNAGGSCRGKGRVYFTDMTEDALPEHMIGFDLSAFQITRSGFENGLDLVLKYDSTQSTLSEDIHFHVLTEIRQEDPFYCEADGHEAYWLCIDCGKLFSDPDGENEIAAPVIIPREPHGLRHFGRVEPTETENGNIEYWRCRDCGKCFADEDGEHEIDPEDVVLPMTTPAYSAADAAAFLAADGARAYDAAQILRQLVGR